MMLHLIVGTLLSFALSVKKPFGDRYPYDAPQSSIGIFFNR